MPADPQPSPEDVELVARVLAEQKATVGNATYLKAGYIVAALASAGRLLPAGTYTEEEYQHGDEVRTVWVGPWRPAEDGDDAR